MKPRRVKLPHWPGHEAATAVLPVFLGTLGAPPIALGTIEGVADAASSFVKLGAGWISDRLGHRKSITVAGYAITGAAIASFGLALSWPVVLIGRLFGWLGRGIRGPLRDAMLAESVPAEARGKAFGFHRAGDTLGAIFGPLLAVGLLALLQPAAAAHPSTPFRIIFAITLIPGLGAALAFALMVTERRRAPKQQQVSSTRQWPCWPGRFSCTICVRVGTPQLDAARLIAPRFHCVMVIHDRAAP